MKTGHYENYLEQFHSENRDFKEKRRKFFKEIEEYGVVVVNMKEIYDQATRFNSVRNCAKV